MDDHSSMVFMALVFGAGLCVAAIVLALLGRRASRRAAVVEATPTLTCEAVQAAGWGAGGQRVVALVGQARLACRAEPHVAEFSGRPCVWYRSVVVEDYWDWEFDQFDNTNSRVERYRLVYDHETNDPFAVHDSTGSVLVHPQGAAVEVPLVLYEKIDETDTSWKDRFIQATYGSGENVIGHRRQEWAILPDDELYVYGAAAGQPGSVRIERPVVDGADYVLTTQPKAVLVDDLRGNLRSYVVGSAAAAVFGVFFLGIAAFG